MCNDDTVNELKKDFHYTLSKFSHEIRNPLTLINSGLQMIASAHPEVEDYEHWDDVMDNLSYVRELLDENTDKFRRFLRKPKPETTASAAMPNQGVEVIKTSGN